VCGHHYNGQVIRPMITILYARVLSAEVNRVPQNGFEVLLSG
jgi:hypothetical protein